MSSDHVTSTNEKCLTDVKIIGEALSHVLPGEDSNLQPRDPESRALPIELPGMGYLPHVQTGNVSRTNALFKCLFHFPQLLHRY